MKTIGRILIILLAAAITTAVMVTLVNSVRSVNFSGRPEGGEFRPQGNQPPQGNFPEGGFPREGGPDRGREGGGSLSRMALGFIKNTVVIGALVALIAIPRSLLSKRKKATPQGEDIQADEQS
jgi:hypothetical protein